MSQPKPDIEGQVFADWVHAPDDIPPQGYEFERSASEDERRSVAELLGLESVEVIGVRYRLKPMKTGNFQLSGRIRAEIVQSCVVTTEPVASVLDESLEAVFGIGENDQGTGAQGDQKILDEISVDPFVNEMIDLGRLCFEVLSAAIDPYPKTSEAKLKESSLTGFQAGSGEEAGPFSVLGKLKDTR